MKTHMHRELTQTALFWLSGTLGSGGGASHCSSLSNWHVSPIFSCKRHPLPSSGQNMPTPHIGGSTTAVSFVLCPFLPFTFFTLPPLPPPNVPYPKGYSSRRHMRGRHTPSPVAFTGAPGGAEQKVVSTHSEMSLCVAGLSFVFFGEHGIGLPDLVRGTPSGSTAHETSGCAAASVPAGGGCEADTIGSKLEAEGDVEVDVKVDVEVADEDGDGTWGRDAILGGSKGKLGTGSERKVEVSCVCACTVTRETKSARKETCILGRLLETMCLIRVSLTMLRD